jgi:hypothetical protein
VVEKFAVMLVGVPLFAGLGIVPRVIEGVVVTGST